MSFQRFLKKYFAEISLTSVGKDYQIFIPAILIQLEVRECTLQIWFKFFLATLGV